MSKHRGFNWGHMGSQKFAGFVFAAALITAAAFWLSVAQFSTLVMGVCGLYGAFVGGRAWSDSSALKYGGTVSTNDVETSAVKKLPTKPAVEKEKGDREID